MRVKTNSYGFVKISLLLLLCVLSVFNIEAKNRLLTGRISDIKGELMPGVTIVEKGSNNATVSGINGEYSITLLGEDPILQVSYIGFEKQEIKIPKNKTLLDIILNEEVSSLDEVQVTAYGSQRKMSVVGAQSQLKMDQIKAPVANMSSLIAGRVSGLVAVQRTGEPGHDDSDIWVRGISTLTNHSTKPLILVDGVERSFNQLDPEDIESVSVLKDASATAVYGVRGGNGVIIITTKPGIVGKPKFSVDYYEGISLLTQYPKMADAYQYMDAANEAKFNTSGLIEYSQEYIEATRKADGLMENDNPQMYNSYLYPNVKWMDELFKDFGNNRRVNLNIRGGAPNAIYYLSLSYYDETGMTKSDKNQSYNSDIRYNRYNFLSNINLKAAEKTKLDIGVQGYFSSGNYPDINTSSVFRNAMTVHPLMYPVLYPNSIIPGFNKENEAVSNPYAELTRRGYKNEYNTTVNSNIKFTQDLDFWDWSKGLQLHAMIAFDLKSSQSLHYRKRENTYKINGTKSSTRLWNSDVYDENGELQLVEEYAQGSNTISYAKGVSSYRTFYSEVATNYKRTFNASHNVSALLLFKVRDYRNPNVSTLYESLPYKELGLSSRITYSYSDRYFTEFNLGHTGSENFSPGYRFGTFPAFAVGWIPSNESFWSPIHSFISFLKIRYSNGYVGSDSLGGSRFGFLSEMKDNDVPGYNLDGRGYSGIEVKRYGTRIRWSTSHKQDLGLDINFFGDRLSFVFDIFKERRNNIYLIRQSIPDYAGFSTLPSGNVGVVDNKGLEISFEYNDSFTKDLRFSLRGNFTWNKDEVVENDAPPGAYPWLNRKGQNVLARFGYVAEGIYSSLEEIKERNIRQFGESAAGDIVKPGDLKYKDLNKDGVIDAYDIMKIGNGDVPRYYFGFGGDLRYKNFALGVLFQGTAGADRHLGGQGIHPFNGDGGMGNLFSNIENRWSENDPTNQNVFYPRLYYGGGDAGNVNNFQTSTWWQKDVSFLRLKQFTLSYYFPEKLIKNTFITQGRLYLMGSNVFTWSNFKLWDPELNTNNGTSYPNVSNYSIGVNFNF